MKTEFICPDGHKVAVEECLEGCRMEHRCAPKPFLRMAAEEREWSGHPSVTMLERCTRMHWLKQRVPYAENPRDSAFRILGTGAHKNMEQHSDEGEHEIRLMLEGISGITDLVELDGDEYVLTDHKTVGSYAVAKMLGIKKVGEKPVLDEFGEPVLYVRGPKTGKPKTEAVYGRVPEEADMSDYTKQPNMYRVAWERVSGKQISRMYIFAIVRDGGLLTAKDRGVTENAYMIPVPFVDDDTLLDWARAKRDEIVWAMDHEEVPPIGTYKETWGGMFCKRFCPVRDACAAYRDNPHLGGEE